MNTMTLPDALALAERVANDECGARGAPNYYAVLSGAYRAQLAAAHQEIERLRRKLAERDSELQRMEWSLDLATSQLQDAERAAAR